MVDLSQSTGFSQRQFSIGQVISRSFEIFIRHAIPLSLVSMFLWIPIYLFQRQILYVPLQQRQYWGLAVIPIMLVIGSLSSGVILYSAFQVMRGRPLKLGESIGRGLARLLPIIGASLLIGLGAGLASILLLVPGVILYIRWYVAIPVCVVEGQGPLSSMKRSAELTKGNRWKIFGYFVLFAIIGGVAGQIARLVFINVLSPQELLLVSDVLSAVLGAFSAVAMAVIYHDLRVTKEGIDIEAIASVFD